MSIAEAPVTDEEVLRPRGLAPSERQRRLGHRLDREGASGISGAHLRAPEEQQAPGPGQFFRDIVANLRLDWLREQGVPRKPMIILLAVGFLTAFNGQAAGILLPLVQRDLRLDPAALVTLLGGVSYIGTLFGPIAGYLGDRLNRVRLLFIGTLVGGAMGALSGTATGLGSMIGTRAGSALAGDLAGPYTSLRTAVVSDIYRPEVRGRAFGSLAAFGTAGGLVTPLVAALAADAFGWRGAFFLLGGIAAAAAVLFLFMREPVRGEVERLEAGLPEERAHESIPPPSFSESMRIVSSVKTLRRLWYAQPFLSVAGTGMAFVNYLIFTQRFHGGADTLAFVATLGSAASLVGIALGIPLVDRFLAYRPGRVMYMLGGALVIDCLAYMVLMFVPIFWIDIPLVLLLPMMGGFLSPAQTAVQSVVIPPRVRAFGLSTTGIFGLPGILVPLVMGSLASNGNYLATMIVLVPLFLAGAAVMASAGNQVEPDMRAAQAAAVADEEARRSRSSGNSKLLICRDVDVTYAGGVQVLFNVDLDVGEGEIVALLGTNGAGKSTLLRAISGLTEASNGAIFFDSRDITHLPTPAVARLGVVQVLGGRAIFPRLTVEENLQAATWLTDEDEQFVSEQRAHILDEFFPVLKTRLTERAGTLSGGEQQMLALSQAFLMKPRLLMIDELSLGLSPAVVEQLLRIVRAIHAQGTTIILVEQSVNVALTVAQRAVFMEKGEVRFDGSTEELLARPDLLRSVFFASAAGAATGSISSTGYGVPVAAQTQTVVLEAEHLDCRFGGVHALRDAHLTLSAGEIVGIIGPNGAGKSTLFDAISGTARIQEGRVVLQGRDVTTMSPDGRARLGLIRSFQDARLFPSMTVAENLAVALERYGVVRSAAFAALWLPHVRRSETRIRKRVDELIELLALGEYSDKFAGELSTGTRRVVDLACMMAADPEVLLLDEPTSGIAQAEVQSFAPLLERVRRETGCAIAIIEHDMTLITAVSDRIVAMELGSVVVEGSADTVLNDPRVVAAYLGTSKEAIARSGTVPL